MNFTGIHMNFTGIYINFMRPRYHFFQKNLRFLPQIYKELQFFFLIFLEICGISVTKVENSVCHILIICCRIGANRITHDIQNKPAGFRPPRLAWTYTAVA